MGRRKEYTKVLTLTKEQINSIKRAQFEMRMEGFKNQDKEELIKNLSTFTSILSFAFMLPTPVTLGAAVISAITSSQSDRDTIISVCEDGEDYLEKLFNEMDDNPDYKALVVELPFLEFIDEGFRIVHGSGIIKKIIKDKEPFPNAKSLDVDDGYRSGAISEKGEEDHYKFTVTQKGKYVIETTGKTDTYGVLYDSDGDKIESDDDDGSRSNFKIREYLVPGTYYVKVYGYKHRETGRYLIKVYSD